MSLLRTLQNQPRIITLFTHNLGQDSSKEILDSLKVNNSGKFNLETSAKFPTLDQLKYMQSVNPTVLSAQIPQVGSILSRPSHDPIFHSDLVKCIKGGHWNPKSSIWVDWEKQHMGNAKTE